LRPTSQNAPAGHGLSLRMRTSAFNLLLFLRIHPATVHPTGIAESHLESLLDSFVQVGIIGNVSSETLEAGENCFCFGSFETRKCPLTARRSEAKTPELPSLRRCNHSK